MRSAVLVLAASLAVTALPAAAGDEGEVKVEGYAEWHEGGVLVVDGQRLALTRGAKFKGRGEAASFGEIPLGYEVKAKGQRRRDEDQADRARKLAAEIDVNYSGSLSAGRRGGL